mgnify:CR=1 FL=1
MNNIKNSIMLIGNLGKDPEVKQLESGKSVAKISLATSDTYKKENGEKVTDTQWHNCVAWGKTAELMGTLLKKGKEVAVQGKLTYRNYEDSNGVKRTIPEIVVSEFALLN